MITTVGTVPIKTKKSDGFDLFVFRTVLILFYLNGAPGESRTPDLLIRSQSLYPAELRAHTCGFKRNHTQIIRVLRAAQSGEGQLKGTVQATAAGSGVGGGTA